MAPEAAGHEEDELASEASETLAEPLIQAANLVNYIVKRYGGHVEFSSRELRVVLPTKPLSEVPGLSHAGL